MIRCAMTRFLASTAAALASAAGRLPANRNLKWAVSAGLWSHYLTAPFTDDILDVMSEAKFFEGIYDLGDKGWICVDLDYTRNGPRASYEHCGRYIVDRLEPIYA